MRQTSQAMTEQQGLRDVDRWKDKIEIRLDNRQVAFLFFGSALIACLLFILGVIVGKRLESRGHAIAPEIEDPLALLDRVAQAAPAAPVTRTLGQIAIGRAYAAPAPVPRAAPAATASVELGAAAAPVRDGSRKQGGTKVDVKVAERADLPPESTVEAPAELPAERPAAKTRAAAPTRPGAIPAPPAGSSPELMPPSGLPASAQHLDPGAASAAKVALVAHGHFMLQVGSFLDRAEAEAYAGSFAAERPIVITSDVPGKGIWYRVRVGDYHAFKEAVDAKLSFEKRYTKLALVVGPL